MSVPGSLQPWRWHVEAPPGNFRHWKHSGLLLSLLLLIVIVALVVGFAARHSPEINARKTIARGVQRS